MTEEQQSEKLREEGKKEIESKSTIDDIINKDTSLAEVVGSIPRPPNINTEYQSIETSREELNKFKKTYFGEDDIEVEQPVEGIITRFLKKNVTKYFGGKEKKVIKGKTGLFEEANKIEQQANKELNKIEKGMPDVNSSITKIGQYAK
ncbi:hypothetical protein GF367_02585, partial [Candidatus Woesearchaeota archaeon]|nr:hypothetical protein [Candidatus Woesearchaeota archaeon]